jgi:cation diffusion facilitator CzcD-associated flavoprotein CzcO
LATSRELGRLGVEHVVLERGDRAGHVWSGLYTSLVLHTGKHLSSLPGLAFPASTPRFPTRHQFLAYLEEYAARFELPIRVRAEVVEVAREDDEWRVRTASGDGLRARALVVATGIVSNPFTPAIADRDRFRGRVLHSVEYRDPDGFRGLRVLVVGVGNSAGEIAAELADADARVTVAVRSGARVVPRTLLGLPAQYLAVALGPLPQSVVRTMAAAVARAGALARGRPVLPLPPDRRCRDVPLIGFHLADRVGAGRIQLKGGLAAFTADGVRFADGSEQAFDCVILATGYRAAVGMLGPLIRRDECGFAARRDRVVSADQPHLYFVGHNYDTRGGLYNIAQDARLVARAIGP